MSWRQKEPEKAGEKGGLDERVPLSLKKFTSTAHSSARRTITQLSFKCTPNSEKKPTYTSPYRAPMGSSRVQAQSVRCVLLGIQARLCEMRVLKGGRADKMKHFL